MRRNAQWLDVLARFRSGGPSDDLAQAWGEGDDRAVAWYRESLRAWLGSSSPRSQETARQVVAFFFAWFGVHYAGSVEGSRLMAPSSVQGSDVDAWARYLEGGGSWVVPAFAGDDLDRRVVQALENAGEGARISGPELFVTLGSPEAPEAFAARLSRLAARRQVDRRPKRSEVEVDDGEGGKRPLRPGEAYPDEVATFAAVPSRRRPAPGSVYARLSVLAGLFRAIMAPKNLPGEAPVRANPASATLVRWKSRRASEETQRSERRKTTRADLELLRAIVERGSRRRGAVQARDRLLVEVLATMGLRVSEVCGARRGDLVTLQGPEGSRPGLRVRRKGGKAQELPLSTNVAEALGALETAIDQSARTPEVRELLRSPAAPLVPALGRWGLASVAAERRSQRVREGRAQGGATSREIAPALVPLGRAGAERVLDRYAREAARQAPEGEQTRVLASLRERWHPHGLRHLFAELAVDGGVPLRVVSEFLGHESTGQLERRYARRPDLAKFDFAPLIAAATRS